MRLSSLKLSGFKSFADSTTFNFKANRTAVVGPNGCGKSNVIDAIRWVMGESSARQLRGGTMQDVIFTGTAQRKPVGMASVELRFDNTYGKLGGAYNAYTELAVRRQVNREGKSEYFLNGTRCRRRDITDIFLGTGLGPRSYAVIEQGMISRLVDAKPDEMRVFIEEAAGVSRYQARRKETLQHLEQAEQNLSRLHDIDSELEKQLKTLKKQVEGALKYKELEQSIRQLKIELLSYQIIQQQQQQHTLQNELSSLSDVFKDVRVELHKLENEFIEQQTAFQSLMDKSKPLQLEWQTAEKALAELTTQVVQKKNQFEQNQQRLEQLEHQQIEDSEKIQLLDIQLEQIYEELEQHTHAVVSLEQKIQSIQKQWSDTKKLHQQKLQQYQHEQQQLSQYQKQQQHQKVQLEQLDKNLQRLQQQKLTLKEQMQQINQQNDVVNVGQLEDEKQQLDNLLAQQNTQVEQAQVQLHEQQQYVQTLLESLRSVESEQKILVAEQKNLQQLVQQAKQGQTQHNLPTLLDNLTLTAESKPYAHVLEKLLSHWLNAHLLAEDELFSSEISRQIKTSESKVKWDKALVDLPSLQEWITQPKWSLCQQIKIVADYTQAVKLQSHLSLGQQILSLDGYLLAQDWQIFLMADESSQVAQGVMSHSIRLEKIAEELVELEQKHQQYSTQYQQAQLDLANAEQQLKEHIQLLNQYRADLQQIVLQLTKLHSQQQALILQSEQLQQQLQQIELQIEEDAMQKDDLEIDFAALQIKIDDLLPNIQVMQLALDDYDELLEQQQQQLSEQQSLFSQTEKQKMHTQQQIELKEKDVSFLREQQQKQAQQIQYLQSALVPLQSDLPKLEKQLDEQAEQTLHLQQTWQLWQDDLRIAQEKQQLCNEQRQAQQHKDEHLRQQLEEKRLLWQSVKSDLEHYQEALSDLNASLLEGLNLEPAQYQQKINQQQATLDKIGAVNLLASQEYEETLQRHNELSHQIDDVEKTVAQLKDAMKSIDQETRSLFMGTFDAINNELKLLFPKVFNGGEASLTLEDDWQSGVKLMARPPGKKNSSLALLSGGEKALTALALVFAIFRLNPAPFCVLDEVDAPLDDANVQRFCNLVEELSEQVQFIYITHNKLAMTMATDLLGVTMPEAGTSKLVSVNIEEAKEYGLA